MGNGVGAWGVVHGAGRLELWDAPDAVAPVIELFCGKTSRHTFISPVSVALSAHHFISASACSLVGYL
jgi:hypothetical protein